MKNKFDYALLDEVPFSKIMEAIHSGVQMCYMDDGYHPELLDFAIEYVNLSTLTDLDMPDDVNEAYKIIREIDGVRSVDADFIADGIRAIIKRNERMTMSVIHNQNVERLADALEATLNKFNSVLDVVKAISDRIETSTSDINIEDINKVITGLSNGSISEEKIATAVLDFQEAKKKKTATKTTKKKTAKKAEN